MKKTKKSPAGTSYFGTRIQTTVNGLKKILGEPSYMQKKRLNETNIEWVCETDSGHIITIYDMDQRANFGDDDYVWFNIGGLELNHTSEALKELHNLWSQHPSDRKAVVLRISNFKKNPKAALEEIFNYISKENFNSESILSIDYDTDFFKSIFVYTTKSKYTIQFWHVEALRNSNVHIIYSLNVVDYILA